MMLVYSVMITILKHWAIVNEIKLLKFTEG